MLCGSALRHLQWLPALRQSWMPPARWKLRPRVGWQPRGATRSDTSSLVAYLRQSRDPAHLGGELGCPRQKLFGAGGCCAGCSRGVSRVQPHDAA